MIEIVGFYLFLFVNHVFVVKVQEPVLRASYDVNKTINNPTAGFTSSWDNLKHPTQIKPIKHDPIASLLRPYDMSLTTPQPPG